MTTDHNKKPFNSALARCLDSVAKAGMTMAQWNSLMPEAKMEDNGFFFAFVSKCGQHYANQLRPVELY